MKLKDIVKMPEKEMEAYIEGIERKLDSISVFEWIQRIRWIVRSSCRELEIDNVDFIDELLKFKTYTVTYRDDMLDEIKTWYSNWSSVELRLNMLGLRVDFRGEDREVETLLNIDGLDELIVVTNDYPKE